MGAKRFEMSESEIASICGGKVVVGRGICYGVSIDSRTIKEGELFVALKGDRFDGHDFVLDAISKGASGAMISRDREGMVGVPDRGFLISVDDTVKGLQRLASSWRTRFEIPVIGITGSVGKTTTKEMVAKVLSTRGPVLANMRSFNNQIGLPLEILKLSEEHWAAVLEMGTNSPGEIATLCGIASPKIGVITSIGKAHTEGLGDIEGIKREKGALLESLPEDGLAILNSDDPNVLDLSKRTRARVVTYGMGSDAAIRAADMEEIWGKGIRIHMEDGAIFEIPLWGKHNGYNALAAVAVGRSLGIQDQEIASSLSLLSPAPMRMELKEEGGVIVIDDSYNANPLSMRAAIMALASTPAMRRIAVLGDMLELGRISEEEHRDLGSFVAEAGVDILLAVGDMSDLVVEGALRAGKILAIPFGTPEEASHFLAQEILPGDAVLVKGSRKVGMEKVVESLLRYLREGAI